MRKKKEIQGLLAKHKVEIETGTLRVLLIDECHCYYYLFKEARISWKKTQANNPKYEPELVASETIYKVNL